MFLGFFVTVIPIPAAVFLGLWIAGQTVYAAMANPNLPGWLIWLTLAALRSERSLCFYLQNSPQNPKYEKARFVRP